MKAIESSFNGDFSPSGIHLPPDDIANRRRGKIVNAGWVIWYLFDADEKGEYLDYYASHRMTDDRHLRIYASGEEVELPAIESFCTCSEAEYYAKNRQIVELLNQKGFHIAGDEPGGVQINRSLRLGTKSKPRLRSDWPMEHIDPTRPRHVDLLFMPREPETACSPSYA